MSSRREPTTRNASWRQQLVGVAASVLWYVGPAICIVVSPMMPRDPVEPEKMTFGAAAGLGIATMAWLTICATLSLFILWHTWATTGRYYKLLLLSPLFIFGLFWLGLIAEGM